MKKTFFLIITFSTLGLNAQSIPFQGDQNINSGIARNNLMDGKEGYKIEGSPFIYINYAKAEVANSGSPVYVRYNAMKDEVEVKNGTNIFILQKDDKFGKIDISETGDKIRLINYSVGKKNIYGYLFLLASKNGVELYRKEEVVLTKEKEAKSAYQESRPAKYQAKKPVYFIREGDGTAVELPKNKKKLIEILPSSKEQIENSNINLSNEEDIIRLINLL